MTELLLIRHGETEWNREKRFQGQIDVPLNEIGHEQARRLAARLATEPVHHLYASDLLRARQTALALQQPLGAGQTAEPDLREQNFGLVDGMRVQDIQTRHADQWAQWIRFDEHFAFEGAESTHAFHARVLAAVQRLAMAHEGQRLWVVTHGGVLDMIYRSALGLSLSGPRTCDIPNAGINRVQLGVSPTGLQWQIVDWADTRHLAGMAPQPVYDQTKLVQPI